ncbi:hypothetical protein PHYPSEUDO_013508 [Phytophthora pseudosyringae]|uniref:RING-type domain-containing protein n=1 Tax=Phytophthora pseudosyringae TaxID=221518 RepID=A0A8T1WM21_9STRA|nr:hypothetical protein PHYPSEUDO_013508 [Phytophthora pseudosyringae]
MELQLSATARYAARHSETVGDVLSHLESPAWVRLVLSRVLPQLKQTSPTDPRELAKMVRDAESNGPPAGQETACAICMEAVAPLELPCGHRFHSTCAQSWLRRRSTCPLCRLQLPKAYTGTFAIAAVRSTLLLPSEHDGLPPSQLHVRPVGGQTLQAAVVITMARMSSLDTTKRRRPCQVSVAMLHTNGVSALMPLGRNARRRREEKDLDAPVAIRGVFKRMRTSV